MRAHISIDYATDTYKEAHEALVLPILLNYPRRDLLTIPGAAFFTCLVSGAPAAADCVMVVGLRSGDEPGKIALDVDRR
jgi:hypothetical protein